MRGILPYIFLFFGSLLAVGIVVGALVVFQPDMLGLAPQVNQAVVDTTGTPPAPSTLKRYGPSLTELRGLDTLSLDRQVSSMLRDSLNLLALELGQVRRENDSLRSVSGAPRLVGPVALSADSAGGTDPRRVAERKAMIKMLETMQADAIVRMIGEMPDDEVKELLLTLKTKQAAKILAALDPDRAAKLIR